MNLTLKTIFITVGLSIGAAAPLVIACSSKSSGSGGGGTTETTTTPITAAAGGTVSDKTGNALLSIPGGALSGDTDITLAVSAATSDTVAPIYDFGPDGTQFSKPAALSIRTDQTPPKDKSFS